MEPKYPVQTHGLVISIGQIKNFLGSAQMFKQLFIYNRQLKNQFCDFQIHILNSINSYKTEDD